MAINFNKDSVFNLKPIKIDAVRDEVRALMIDGEEAVMAFKTIRDQLVFTNKRIISIDVQGLTGTRKSYTSMPYSKILFFSIQTPSIAELFVPDSELVITFANGFNAKFEFKGDTDISQIGRIISKYILL
ncbi:MAG: PH domain-containing protein [Clostridiales bacterium]|nr:PH domain-containing protein [Candidatus Cacconaster stercorequi]